MGGIRTDAGKAQQLEQLMPESFCMLA